LGFQRITFGTRNLSWLCRLSTSENEPSNPWHYIIDTPEEIQKEIYSIERLITSHNMKPFITDLNLEIPLGKKYTAQDKLLKEYTLKTQSDEITLNNDTLSIIPKDHKTRSEVVLERKNNYWTYPQLFYYSSLTQNLLTLGNTSKEIIKFSYVTYSGKIKVKKVRSKYKTMYKFF